MMKHDPLSNEWMEELMPKALIIGFVVFVSAIIGSIAGLLIAYWIIRDLL